MQDISVMKLLLKYDCFSHVYILSRLRWLELNLSDFEFRVAIGRCINIYLLLLLLLNK